MFRSIAQQARACATLCNALPRLQRLRLWGPDGPQVRVMPHGLSSGEATLWRVSLAIWCADRKATMANVLALDNGNLRRVGTLLAAVADGPEAVDAWIREHSNEREVAG